MTLQDHLLQLLAAGKHAEVLALLIQYVPTSAYNSNFYLIQSSKFNKNEQDFMSGIVSAADYHLVTNQITHALVSLIKDDPFLRTLQLASPPPPVALRVVCQDVLAVSADMLVLKFARRFHNVDKLVAQALGHTQPQVLSLDLGIGHVASFAASGLAFQQALFVGVEALDHFRYPQIETFGQRAIAGVKHALPAARRVAFTLHGAGYGLSRTEAFAAQLRGIRAAIAGGNAPTHLSEVLIVDHTPAACQSIVDWLTPHAPALRLQQTGTAIWQLLP